VETSTPQSQDHSAPSVKRQVVARQRAERRPRRLRPGRLLFSLFFIIFLLAVFWLITH
jgi:hypothetical protein